VAGGPSLPIISSILLIFERQVANMRQLFLNQMNGAP
jgi:hypothetical protein